jgi:hypothetical protein
MNTRSISLAVLALTIEAALLVAVAALPTPGPVQAVR